MSPLELKPGATYFMVTYPGPTMDVPVVISYTFLGIAPPSLQEDEPGPHYYFRHLPAFSYVEEAEERTEEDNWAEVFPKTWFAWGERFPTSFSEEKVKGFLTLDGLINELGKVRKGLQK